ncbi:hypothetical protein BACPLE_01385 [Phocaeicola plebeius DSM 17135]|uniref:Uncharacterized protein n=1 Tax=Phocaeicola plebeius (strain DSM 17135 / JCM 12973 / CCUG 54634 / M2) TaxID=484018 RepID=B5CXE4_PHOPM|nr:three component ABC system middle component [Phocaeicola plebeius]EDY96079.1 hypothetical protein BACPLE_01385 [Phocaeicola plebeius DSM 17135]
MSKLIENISTLQSNIFILTPILVSFYRNLQPKDKNILLAYFVFPLVLNSDFLKKITTVSRASRLSRITNDKEIMAGFEERFEYFKYITNHCLQYALECGYIKINDDLSVTVLVDNNLQIDCRLSKSINLASQLHKIFTRNVINTYYAFGIYKL